MKPLLFTVAAFCLLSIQEVQGSERPNILLFYVDDLNDWISLLDPDSPIKTPNLQRLADQGMLFRKAYCASPACNPSRAATLTGLRPTTTGAYGNKSDWRKAVGNRSTIFKRFREASYQVRGAGKIFHHHLDGAFHDEDSFDQFQPMPPQLYPEQKLNRAPEYGSRNTDWGAWPPRVEDSIDFRTAEYCVQQISELAEADAQPFFLACGIFKPHSPFFAPTKFHEGNEDVGLPVRNRSDWSDLPSGATVLMAKKRWFWNGMMTLDERIPNSYHDFVRAYAACVKFADFQIGKVLDALEDSPARETTIVVLMSDHGFHLGEKDHIEKFALWEKSNHIPFVVVAPGITAAGVKCDVPIDMTVLYPTLLDLAGLQPDPKCDGSSIVPLLKDPLTVWESPAIMTYLSGNHAVRSARWRYIRYADGSEELYDHEEDPHEWTNLAANPELQPTLRQHRKWLPSEEAEPVADLKPR